MGAMIYGEVYSDRIQVNEHTIWSGGPGADAHYNGGHIRTPEQNKQNLQDVRRALQQSVTELSTHRAAYRDSTGKVIAGNYADNEDLRMLLLGRTEAAKKQGRQDPTKGITGSDASFGSYQTLGNIDISYHSDSLGYTDYVRKLDIDNAMKSPHNGRMQK
jgi:alpha-L-fucosidase 2